MKAKLRRWQGTGQQIVIGLAVALVIVAVIEANSDYDEDCGWSFMGTDVSHYGRGDRQKIRIGHGHCRIDMDLRGEIDFTADNRGVARLGPGASLTIKERRRGERRRIDVERGPDGQPEYSWYVNSLPRQLDDEGRAWLAEILPRIYRTTGLDADGRVTRLWDESGPDAVFEEMQRLANDSVRGIYLRQVFARATDDEELVHGLDFARREISSDYELARSLGAFDAASLARAPVREAWTEAAKSIDSDWELRRCLSAILDERDLDPAVLDALLEAALKVGSDHDQAELLVEVAREVPPATALPPSYFSALETVGTDYELKRVLAVALARPELTEPLQGALLESAKRISNDFELADLLASFARSYPAARQLPRPFFAALATIDSDSAKRRALSAVVAARALDRKTAASLLEVARSVSTDFELSAFLVDLLDAYPGGEELPEELDRTLGTVDSDFEREKVERALESFRQRQSLPRESPAPSDA